MPTTTQTQNVGKKKLPSEEQAALTATIKRLNSNLVNQVVCMATLSESGFDVTFDADGQLYDATIQSIEVVANAHEAFLNTFFGPNKTVLTISCAECGVVKYGEAKLYKVLVGSMFKHNVQDILKRSEEWNADFLKRSEEWNAVCIRESLRESRNEKLALILSKRMQLLEIRGDGNCYSRCLAMIIFWLHQNSKVVPGYEKFKNEFNSVLDTFTHATTMLSISKEEKDVHMAVRNLISTRLEDLLTNPNFLDSVNSNCENNRQGNCKDICDCPLVRCVTDEKGDVVKIICQCVTDGCYCMSLHEELGDKMSYKTILLYITKTIKENKFYSGTASVVMGFQMLKPYCNAILLIVRYPNGDLEKPSRDQNIGGLSAFVVYENYGFSKGTGASNHFSLLVRDSVDPRICTPASLTKEIFDIIDPEFVSSNTNPLICTSASGNPSITKDNDVLDISDSDSEVTPRDASISSVTHYFTWQLPLVLRDAIEEFQVDLQGTDIISAPGWLSNKTVDFFMTLYVHFFQTTECTHVYMLSNIFLNLVRNAKRKSRLKESFANEEIRMSWWKAERTVESISFTDEEKKHFCGTEFFFFAVPWSRHWVLAIVCFAGNCVHDETFPDKQPCVFFFDSFKIPGRLFSKFEDSGLTLGELINSFLNLKFSTTKFTNATMPIYECEVPQQANGKDCGVYALEFAVCFLRNPNYYYNVLRHDATKNLFGASKDFAIIIQNRRREYVKFLTDAATVEGFREMFINVQNKEVEEALILPPKLDEKSGMKI